MREYFENTEAKLKFFFQNKKIEIFYHWEIYTEEMLEETSIRKNRCIYTLRCIRRSGLLVAPAPPAILYPK